ncbi:MAG: glutathione peroxidase [Chitinophagales bacterium]|nr:glutathione peroxidase [Chitinophagales bacterium]
MDNSVYTIPLNDIHGKPMALENFRGKKILLVNTASECGLTPHYAQLQELYENFKDKVVVVGLPCNDFGGQEPGTEEQIINFCETNYKITFPLAEKVKILGDNIHPLYAFLTKKEMNGYADSEVKWNFQKYLIDENGKLIKVFSPVTEPLSEEVLDAIG